MKMQQAFQSLIDNQPPDVISRFLLPTPLLDTLLKILPHQFKVPVASCCQKSFALSQDFLALDLDACVSFEEPNNLVDIKTACDVPLVTPANAANAPLVEASASRQETLLSFICRHRARNNELSNIEKYNLTELIHYLLDNKAKANIKSSTGSYPAKYLIECDYIPTGLVDKKGVFGAFNRMLSELNLETVRIRGKSFLDMIWERNKSPFFVLDDSYPSLDTLTTATPKQKYHYDARFFFLYIFILQVVKKHPDALSKKLTTLTDRQYDEAQWTYIMTLYNMMLTIQGYADEDGDDQMFVVSLQSAVERCNNALNKHYKETIEKLEQENRVLKAQINTGNTGNIENSQTAVIAPVRPLLMHPVSAALVTAAPASIATAPSVSINIVPSSVPTLSETNNNKAEHAATSKKVGSLL